VREETGRVGIVSSFRTALPRVARAIRARLRARAPPTLSALSARASRARTLTPPPPPPSAAEGVEPARITDVLTRSRTRTGTWRCRRPRRARHRAARMSMASYIHTRRRWSSALVHRACARESTPASPTATCTPRPPDGPLLHTPFVLRTVPTAHVCARPGPLHQISRPRLDIGLVYRSSTQVAVPHAPFLGAALPAALPRVSRFIRSHTECTALASRLASSTAPRASRPSAWPLPARRLSCALYPPC
jgi:hypothetical protein